MDKDEAEHLMRMIVGNWRHSPPRCYSRDMDMEQRMSKSLVHKISTQKCPFEQVFNNT